MLDSGKRFLVAIIGLFGVALLSAGGVIAVQNHKIDKLAMSVRNVGLSRDSAVAASSTTQERKLALLADSVRFFERRAVQTGVRADELDKQLSQVTKARAELVAQIAELKGSVNVTVVSDANDSVRSATVHRREEPYTLDISARLPKPPAEAEISYHVVLDSVKLGVRVSCGPRVKAGEIRTATVSATPPPWLPLRIDNPTLDADLCNPLIPPQKGVSRWWLPVSGLGAGAATGAVVGADGSHAVQGAAVGTLVGVISMLLLKH
ncbi:MAG TPA: hypothetical protein VF832_08215 [Longimicrobiales bacterium]